LAASGASRCGSDDDAAAGHSNELSTIHTLLLPRVRS